jgi:hypothetical protein
MDRFEKMITGLKKDMEVPDPVMSKYMSTLSSISEKGNSEVYGGIKKKGFVSAAAVLIALTGAVTVGAAAYSQWSRSIDANFQPTEVQKAELEESGAVDFIGQSVTSNGVTVSVQQSIVDNYMAYISLKVDGYMQVEDFQPDFRSVNILINGQPVEASMEFRTFKDDEYIMEDGSFEYDIIMYGSEKGYFIDKPVHIEINDIGHYTEKAADDIVLDMEGSWNFDFNLGGNASMDIYEPNAPLGDSGITLLYAELSPLSASLKLDMPRVEITETGIDVEGNPVSYETYKSAPQFMGIRLKDGTIQKVNASESGRYIDENSDIYEKVINFSAVLDVDEVDSLLFLKDIHEIGQPLTEENYYVVPLN